MVYFLENKDLILVNTKIAERLDKNIYRFYPFGSPGKFYDITLERFKKLKLLITFLVALIILTILSGLSLLILNKIDQLFMFYFWGLVISFIPFLYGLIIANITSGFSCGVSKERKKLTIGRVGSCRGGAYHTL